MTRILKNPQGAGYVVRGTAEPNAEVRIENRSITPHAENAAGTYTTVRADRQGLFDAVVPDGQGGDYVVLSKPGRSPLTLRIDSAIDTRPLEHVNQQSLRLVQFDEGVYELQNVAHHEQFSEPFATLRLVNQASGDVTEVKLDEQGRLPDGVRVKGDRDTVFSYSISDGTHTFDDGCKLHVGHVWGENPSGSYSGMSERKLEGPLFKSSTELVLPVQGSIGDCWFVATAAALAAKAPDRLRKMMTELDDGRVAFTFHQWADEAGGAHLPYALTVDRTVFGGATFLDRGRATYGRTDSASIKKMEAWWPLLEKAYAHVRGGFSPIKGGYPEEAFEILLGVKPETWSVPHLDADQLFADLSTKLAQGALATASTTEDPGRRLTGNHAYTLMSVQEDNGNKTVTLRNPWGGRNDGMITLSLARFVTSFERCAVAMLPD